jgi:hypothetical protein
VHTHTHVTADPTLATTTQHRGRCAPATAHAAAASAACDTVVSSTAVVHGSFILQSLFYYATAAAAAVVAFLLTTGHPVFRCPKTRCGTCAGSSPRLGLCCLPVVGPTPPNEATTRTSLHSFSTRRSTMQDAGRTISRSNDGALFMTIKETTVAIDDDAAVSATRDTAVDSHVVVHGSFIPQLLFSVVVVVVVVGGGGGGEVLLLLLLPSTFVVVDAATAGAAAFGGQERSQM